MPEQAATSIDAYVTQLEQELAKFRALSLVPPGKRDWCDHSVIKCGNCLKKERDSLVETGPGPAPAPLAPIKVPVVITDMVAPAAPAAPLKLDLGCGPNKAPGYSGVDSIAFPGVDTVCNLFSFPWPWADNSVEAVHCSHFLEHVPGKLRPAWFSELWRIMKPGAQAVIITPHWCSARAYGDPTHEWPPVSEFAMHYLDRQWRNAQAPHDNELYKCDFTHVVAHLPGGHLIGRNQEYLMHALQNFKEAAADMQTVLTKRA